MTTEQLDVIRERCEMATPGPWIVTGKEHYMKIETRAETDPFRKHGRLIVREFGIASPCTIGQSNADFVAHSRTDIPALLNEIDRLRKLISAPEPTP